MIGDEAKDEGGNGDAQGDHQRPDAHVARAVSLKEGFSHHRAANRRRRADEESDEGSARGHGRIAVALRAADVADETGDEGQQKDGPASVSIGQWPPEQRRTAQDGNLERSEIRCPLEGDAEICGDVLVRRDDASCGEGRHAGVEGHQNQVGHFLSTNWISRVFRWRRGRCTFHVGQL